MKYVVGIDGGGTKTQLWMSDMRGNILEKVQAGPSNLLSCGYDITKVSIEEVLKVGILNRGYVLEDCQVLCIGVAGGAREMTKHQITEIIRRFGYEGKLIVTHDAETALVAGCKGSAGILLIAGTGAICYARAKNGVTHRVSGWGHLMGDEGSAYSIGSAILKAVMHAYDGRGSATQLTALVLEKMKVASPEEIVTQTYGCQDVKSEIASYAVLLEKAIDKKDAVAQKIADDTVDALVQNIVAMAQKIDCKDEQIKLFLAGSVLTKNDGIKKAFIQQVQKRYPNIVVEATPPEAVYGAIILGLSSLKK
ncbi:MAG: N-acetylglucosamine kinase [Cellulosilyticaceae bacterium]